MTNYLIEFINNISTSLAVKMNGEYIVREKNSIKQWLLQEVSENDIYTRIIGKKSACD